MSDSESGDGAPESDPTADTIAFDYLKSPLFRVVRADGAIGGITPNGHIHMTLYSERQAIPRRVTYELKADKTLGPIREIHSRDSIVREMDVDIFLTIDAAKSLSSWLNDRISELQDGKPKNAN